MLTEQSFPRARATAEAAPVYGIVIRPPRAQNAAPAPFPRLMAADPSELERGLVIL